MAAWSDDPKSLKLKIFFYLVLHTGVELKIFLPTIAYKIESLVLVKLLV
jgi:hypothetical protein